MQNKGIENIRIKTKGRQERGLRKLYDSLSFFEGLRVLFSLKQDFFLEKWIEKGSAGV